MIATANTDTMAQLTAQEPRPDAGCPSARTSSRSLSHQGIPLGIKTLADLNNPGVKLVIGDPSVPVGEYVTDIEASDNIKFTPVSLQLSDASVLEQLESGDANAALVFVTDVIGAGSKVTGVPIPDAQNKIGTYDIAAVSASSNLPAAEAFVTSAVSGATSRLSSSLPASSRHRRRDRGRHATPAHRSRHPGGDRGSLHRGPAHRAAGARRLEHAAGTARVDGRAHRAPAFTRVLQLIAVAISLVIGVPLAYLLARSSLPGRRVIRGLVTLPLVLPPVVGGIALQTALGTTTPIGTVLQHFGIVLPFSTAGAAIAEAFVGFPFLVITSRPDSPARRAFRGGGGNAGRATMAALLARDHPARGTIDRGGSCALLGASAWRVRRHDHVRRQLSGHDRDPPHRRVQLFEGSGNVGTAITLSLVLLTISILVLVVLRDRWLGALR